METKNVKLMMKKYAPLIFTFLMVIIVSCSSGDDGNDSESNTPDPVTTTDPPVATFPTKGEKQITSTFSISAGGERGFYISLPDNYSSDTKHKLVLVFPATNSTGKSTKSWMGDGWSGSVGGLESKMTNTIFVYPDPKWRNFPTWGNLGGWLLGPYAGNATGVEDINFIKELLDLIQKEYNIDSERIFGTGQSWGGDMSAIVGCFLGDKFRAIAPCAANRPYWFEIGNTISSSSDLGCLGNTAVWTFFGTDDDFFDGQEPTKGDFGREQNQFWLSKYACESESTVLDIEPIGESLEYKNCSSTVRFTLYAKGNHSGAGDLPGHYPPDYFLTVVPEWFNSF